MSTATIGKHARQPGPDRESWFGRRWRRNRKQAQPETGNPYPEAPSEQEIAELIGQLPSVKPLPTLNGASLLGEPDGMLPDDTGTLAAIREAALPADAMRILQRTRDGIRDLDKPPSLAFVRRSDADGGFGLYWPLDGDAQFLGLARCEDRQVAEVVLGYLPDGRPWIFAGDVASIDARMAVLMVARDRLVYGSGIGSTPAAEPPATEEQAQPEVPAEPETTDAPEPAPDGDDREDPHAFLISRATGVLGRAAFLPEPEDQAAADEISSKTAVLANALNLYGSVSDGTFEPFWVFADLAAGEDGSRTIALERLAADIADAQEALIEVTRKYRDDETAALVAGQAGGAQ